MSSNLDYQSVYVMRMVSVLQGKADLTQVWEAGTGFLWRPPVFPLSILSAARDTYVQPPHRLTFSNCCPR